MDEVQCLNIDSSEPLHHIHEARHELLVGHDITLDRTVSWTYLLTCLTIYATADGIGQALGEVSAGTEELHLLTSLSSTDAAADAVVVAPYRTHHVVVLILDTACLHGDHRSIALESFRQTTAVEHGEVRFGRRSHVLQSVEETEVVLRHHVTAVLTDTCHLECCPYGVTREELVVGRNTSELHHTELHHEMVDELLGILLGEGALVEIALDIDIEECRDTAYRHGCTVLCLHGTEVTEVEPLHSLACVRSRL